MAATTKFAHPEWLPPVPFARIRLTSTTPRNGQGRVDNGVEVTEGMGMGKSRRVEAERERKHSPKVARARDRQGRGITPPLRMPILNNARRSQYQRSDETNERGDGAYLGRSRNRSADGFSIVGIEINVSSPTRARPVK